MTESIQTKSLIFSIKVKSGMYVKDDIYFIEVFIKMVRPLFMLPPFSPLPTKISFVDSEGYLTYEEGPWSDPSLHFRNQEPDRYID